MNKIFNFFRMGFPALFLFPCQYMAHSAVDIQHVRHVVLCLGIGRHAIVCLHGIRSCIVGSDRLLYVAIKGIEHLTQIFRSALHIALAGDTAL